MADLTAVILTMNENKNIKDCINSIKGLASRIIVVDSGSTDNTVEIAKSLGADVYFHEFEHYATQFNWALDNTNITTKWVLRLDADERLTDKLCEEAVQAINQHENDNVNGMVIKLRVYFLDRWIKHGGIYPFRKLMLFKYSIGRLENRKKDAHTILLSGTAIELKEDALHYDFKNINSWTNKHNWYATREMQDFYEIEGDETNVTMANENIMKRRKLKKNVYYRAPIFYRAHLYFIYRYIFRLGFLDGKEGKIFHFLQAYWYRFLVDAKIYEHAKMGNKMEELKALKD